MKLACSQRIQDVTIAVKGTHCQVPFTKTFSKPQKDANAATTLLEK